MIAIQVAAGPRTLQAQRATLEPRYVAAPGADESFSPATLAAENGAKGPRVGRKDKTTEPLPQPRLEG
jgi:hypothetical protein